LIYIKFSIYIKLRTSFTAGASRLEKVGASKFFILKWTIRNMDRRGLRICSYLLYSIGLSLIAIPAASNFLQVTRMPPRRLWS
jgi:hypothetical protein